MRVDIYILSNDCFFDDITITSTDIFSLFILLQTSRVWDSSNGECKMDFRGHDHVVECAIFAPVNAYSFIRELIGSNVSFDRVALDTLLLCNRTMSISATIEMVC